MRTSAPPSAAARRDRHPDRGAARRAGLVTLTVAALLAAAGGTWAASSLLGGPSGDQRTVAADGPVRPGATTDDAAATGRAFLAAWQAGRFRAMQALVADQVRDDMVRVYGNLQRRLHLSRVRVVPGALVDGDRLPFRATLTLAGRGSYAYAGQLPLTRTVNGWRVAFTPATLHPRLKQGQTLDLVPATLTSASFADRSGRPLSQSKDLVANVVGRAGTEGLDPTGLQRLVAEGAPGIPAATGKAVALAVVDGTSGETVSALRTWGTGRADAVRTTFDLRVQRAAERALAGVPGRTALVAIDVATGQVRALADRPVSGQPAALDQFAPGSTFKIVTAAAALRNGRTPWSRIECTPTVQAGGRAWRNHEGSRSGTTSLRQAFAASCNTAFVRLAGDLPRGAVERAAADFGFDGSNPLPIAALGGSVKPARQAVDAAAAAIGQGTTLASPLHMASVAAGVASGRWHQPRILRSCPDCASHPVPAAGSLRSMMRAVVTDGTASAAFRGYRGSPVFGKTGTAEYGDGAEPATHAWFVGWRGDLAFAVFVENGSSGGTVAAPVARRFLDALA